jgi:hypothetical protein
VADYFLLLNGTLFDDLFRPVLAASWRTRSFEPCREFCRTLLPRVEEFDSRHHIREGESLVEQVVRGLAFHRDFWRALVGELLFYAAEDIPEFQTCPDTLCCILAPEHYRIQEQPRDRLALIQQAHRGSRDLVFGPAVYRPEHCGYNDRADVARLADYLRSVNPSRWKAEDLAPLTELREDEREEELQIAQEWFEPLREMYRRAAAAGQVIVHEIL